MTSPPFSLIAFSPRLPSAPVPERITQIGALAVLRPPASAGRSRTAGARRGAPAAPRGGARQRGSRDRRRRNDIDMLALERHAIGRLQYLHLRMAGQQLDHHAVMRRVEMLDQDEGHAVVGRQARRRACGRRRARPPRRRARRPESSQPGSAGGASATNAGSPAGEPVQSIAKPVLPWCRSYHKSAPRDCSLGGPRRQTGIAYSRAEEFPRKRRTVFPCRPEIEGSHLTGAPTPWNAFFRTADRASPRV